MFISKFSQTKPPKSVGLRQFATNKKYTFGLLKPDLIKQHHFDLNLFLQRNDLALEKSALMRLSKQQAEEFYGEHKGKFFYPRLVSFMTR